MTTLDLEGLLDGAEPAMVEIRHDLHAHPELAFAEHRTTGVVTARLAELGWTLHPSPTATGAVATLEGAGPGARVMVRADIDALPVDETRELPWRSVVNGVMHACGHDVHTAALLGVAEVLARAREHLAGSYTLVFQPAEETIGGARAMIAGGLLEHHPADALLGAHAASILPLGVVATRPGILMSRGTLWRIRLEGAGGHGAMAATRGNVVLAASALAPRLGEAVAGLSYQGTDCACSAGVLAAGTKENVVPTGAHLAGTLRTFTEDQFDEGRRRLGELVAALAEEFGVRAVLEVTDSTPPVANDRRVTDVVRAAAERLLGPEGVLEAPPVTPSDDVAELLARVPGCYLLVGGALADGTSGMHHSPDFALEDATCRVQAGVLAAGAIALGSGE
ncbi:MAG TPA: M20 family metallopeptidase [Acidimicrobiales bacterium]|nr:M20 family metallopeptidase [Acidimicrobiales bacterium]